MQHHHFTRQPHLGAALGSVVKIPVGKPAWVWVLKLLILASCGRRPREAADSWVSISHVGDSDQVPGCEIVATEEWTRDEVSFCLKQIMFYKIVEVVEVVVRWVKLPLGSTVSLRTGPIGILAPLAPVQLPLMYLGRKLMMVQIGEPVPPMCPIM